MGYYNDYEYDDIYDGYEEGVDEIRGITDTVTDYTYTNLLYPCIIFKEGMVLEKHKVQVISNMMKGNLNSVDKDISIYFCNDGQIYKIGNISGVQVSFLLEIVGTDKLDAYLSKNEKLVGDKIYTLCNMFV